MSKYDEAKEIAQKILELEKTRKSAVDDLKGLKEELLALVIYLSKNDYSSCGSYCRLYIGVHMPATDKEMSTTTKKNQSQIIFPMILLRHILIQI